MKNKHTAGIISTAIVLAEFIVFLIWGLNLPAGDEMGYGLIVLYGIMPLTALILTAVLSTKKSVFFFPVALLAILSSIFIPFILFSNFEATYGLFTLIPCIIGGVIGLTINKIKNK